MKETVIFAIVVVEAIATGIYLVRRRKPEQIELISEEQALRTLERATEALASAKTEVKRVQERYESSLPSFIKTIRN
jgi:hypothetical protein